MLPVVRKLACSLAAVGVRVCTLPVLVWFGLINDRLPRVVGRPLARLFHRAVQWLFRLSAPLSMAAVADWPRVLNGPARAQLPSS